MKIEKALKRERKQHKQRNGMQVSNKSIFTLVQVSTGKKKRNKRNPKIIDKTERK